MYFGLVLLNSLFVKGQEAVAEYYFLNGLEAASKEFPPLRVEKVEGVFKPEVVPNLGRLQRKVYVFSESAGLTFENSKVPTFINGDFTVEMYFRYDNGDLLLYNQLIGDKLKVKEGSYVHLVVSRNAETKQIITYLNGEKTLEFVDESDNMALAPDREITFFSSENQVTSGGAVAIIRIYNKFVTESESDKYFGSFKEVLPSSQPLFSMESGKINLKTLFFVRSKAEFIPESIPALDALADLLKENESMKVEIHGHTDNQGDFKKNIQLSKDRSEAVLAYLVSSGISKDRLLTRGFGSSRPIAANNNEENRQKNRRVEIIVQK